MIRKMFETCNFLAELSLSLSFSRGSMGGGGGGGGGQTWTYLLVWYLDYKYNFDIKQFIYLYCADACTLSVPVFSHA